jgi:hypothetical protein
LGIALVDLEGQVVEIPPLRFGLYRDDFDGFAQNTGFLRKRRGTIASREPI